MKTPMQELHHWVNTELKLDGYEHRVILDKIESMLQKEKPQSNIGAVISRYFTLIKVKRDHSTRSGFFIVNVPEVKQYGFGFTLYIKGTVYGFSIHNNGL